MRIGIDARIAATDRGMGRVFRFQLSHMLALNKTDEFVLFTPAPPSTPVGRANVKNIVLGTPFVPAYEQLALPKAVADEKLDVLWCPANTGPVNLKTPIVLTLHDVIFRHRGQALPHSPSLYQRLGRRYTDWSATLVASRASHVLTDSEFSAKEIRQLLPVKPENVSVIQYGVTISETGKSVGTAKLIELGITRPFFLLLGATDPRKNTRFSIQTFIQSSAAESSQLVVTGLKPSEVEAYQLEFAQSPAVVFLGFVSDELLAGFYRHCLALVMPSLSEGFGLPVLEAMSFGAPVLSSNLTSLPEIGGDAVLYFNPTSTEELAEGLAELLNNPALRKTLGNAGKVRAKQFSWQAAAEIVLQRLRAAAP